MKQSWFLLKTIFKNNKGLSKKNKKEGTSKTKRALTLVGFAVLAIFLGAAFAMQAFAVAYETAKSAPQTLPQALTVFYFLGQTAILFFGMFQIMGTFFFSKDNALLLTLPIQKPSIFIAKFLYSYFSQLMLSAFFVLVMISGFGAGCLAAGYQLSAWFFVIEVVSVLFMPVLPLILVTLLSFPVMYFVSLIKKSKIATMVVNITFSLLFVAVCLLPSLLSASGNGGSALVGILGGLSKVTVFNLPLANSMFLKSAAGNFFLYFAIMLVGFLLVVGVAALTYPRILAKAMETGETKHKKKSKKAEYKSLTFQRTYLKKELKTICSTPTLIANIVLPLVMLPFFIFMFVKTGFFGGLGGEGATSEFGAAGFVLYLSCLIVSVSPLAMMGFSMEGKNLLFLKTLPISIKQIIRLKLRIVDTINLAISAIIFVCFSIASNKNDVLLAAIMALIVFGYGMSFSRFGLYSDLKQPFLNWQNIQEINKNSKRAVKPMLCSVAGALVFLVLGMLLDAGKTIAMPFRYLIFGVVGLLIDALVYLFTAKKLFDNADALWEKIEG